MAYLQVKDILAHAEQLRKFVNAYSQRHQSEAKDDLLAGLFEEANRHEKQLEDVLSEYRAGGGGREGVLDTWLQFPGVDALTEAMEQLAAIDQQDDEIVIQQLLVAEQSLADCYEQAESQTSASEVQELFGRLKELQETHLQTVASCASEFEQLRRPGS